MYKPGRYFSKGAYLQHLAPLHAAAACATADYDDEMINNKLMMDEVVRLIRRIRRGRRKAEKIFIAIIIVIGVIIVTSLIKKKILY